MNSTALKVRFWITSAVTAVMAYAMIVSASHITHVAYTLHIGPAWQQNTAWILVDLPALIGKVLQIRALFTGSTNTMGRKLTYFSGSISLACNVGSGLIDGSYGAAGWGAFVVMMFLVLEGVITRIKVTQKLNNRDRKTEQAPASEATLTPAQRGAITRRRNREIRELEAAMAATQ